MKKFEKLSDGKFKQFEISNAAKIIGGDRCIPTFEGYTTDTASNEVSNQDLKCVDTAEVDE